jgi:hypothetical protein
MALGDSALPYSGQLGNIGSFAGPVGAAALGGAIPQQQQLASTLQGLAGPNYSGGSAAGFDIQSLLSQLGGGLAQQGAATEASGTLPASGQAAVQTALNDEVQNIKGKYASLGMTGSSAEQQAITDAQNRSFGQSFTLAEQLGGQQVSQGLSSLTTAGSLSTTLAQLGLSTYGLTSTDLGNIATEGASALGLSSEVFSNLQKTQMASDQQLTNTIMGFAKALGGNAGMFGNQGLIPGASNFFGSGGLGGGAPTAAQQSNPASWIPAPVG